MGIILAGRMEVLAWEAAAPAVLALVFAYSAEDIAPCTSCTTVGIVHNHCSYALP